MYSPVGWQGLKETVLFGTKNWTSDRSEIERYFILFLFFIIGFLLILISYCLFNLNFIHLLIHTNLRSILSLFKRFRNSTRCWEKWIHAFTKSMPINHSITLWPSLVDLFIKLMNYCYKSCRVLDYSFWEAAKSWIVQWVGKAQGEWFSWCWNFNFQQKWTYVIFYFILSYFHILLFVLFFIPCF